MEVELSKLSGYEYPTYVMSEIQRIVDCFSVSAEVLSVIVIGSCSRGELIYDSRGIQSDIEFFIITEPCNKHELEDLFNSKLTITTVDVDFSILTYSELIGLKPRLILADSISTGVCLYGVDYMCRLSTLTAKDLAEDDVDEIILFRLLDIYVEGKKAGEIAAYNNAIKNVLYVLTWALIQDGVLLHSFKDKVDYFKSRVGIDVTCKVFLDCQYLIDMAADIRSGQSFSVDEDVKTDILRVYTRVVAILADKSFKCSFKEYMKNMVYGYRSYENIKTITPIRRIFKSFTNNRREITLALLEAIYIELGRTLVDEKFLNDNSIDIDVLPRIITGYFVGVREKMKFMTGDEI